MIFIQRYYKISLKTVFQLSDEENMCRNKGRFLLKKSLGKVPRQENLEGQSKKGVLVRVPPPLRGQWVFAISR